MKTLKKLGDYGFPTKNSTFIIAEIGLNHNGSIDLARKLIDSAARTGCDAVKFQTYQSEKRAPKNSAIFNILKECELPMSAFGELKRHTEQYPGLTFFSTPFDDESMDVLEDIGCQLVKIASFDIVNMALLRRIARAKKTTIFSVGMSDLKEIKSAYEILSESNRNIALLHCVSAYPTEPKDSNLAAIFELQRNFDSVIGHSDHTNGIQIPLYAVAAGAQVIEKHYRIDSEMSCVDAPVSISEVQMRDLVKGVREIEKIHGEEKVQVTEPQKGTMQFRRPSP